MQIDQMADLWGASKYGSCTECAKGITADENAIKLTKKWVIANLTGLISMMHRL